MYRHICYTSYKIYISHYKCITLLSSCAFDFIFYYEGSFHQFSELSISLFGTLLIFIVHLNRNFR